MQSCPPRSFLAFFFQPLFELQVCAVIFPHLLHLASFFAAFVDHTPPTTAFTMETFPPASSETTALSGPTHRSLPSHKVPPELPTILDRLFPPSPAGDPTMHRGLGYRRFPFPCGKPLVTSAFYHFWRTTAPDRKAGVFLLLLTPGNPGRSFLPNKIDRLAPGVFDRSLAPVAPFFAPPLPPPLPDQSFSKAAPEGCLTLCSLSWPGVASGELFSKRFSPGIWTQFFKRHACLFPHSWGSSERHPSGRAKGLFPPQIGNFLTRALSPHRWFT